MVLQQGYIVGNVKQYCKSYTLLGQFLNLKFLILYQGNHLVLHLISRNQLKPK